MLLLRSLLIFFGVQGLSLASYFHDPKIPNNEFTVYHAFEKGKVVPIERKITLENNCYRIEHTDTTGLLVISLIDTQSLKTVKVEKFRWGKPTLMVACDSTHIFIEDLLRNKRRRLSVRGPVYDRHTIFEVFRGFPFNEKKKVEFPLLLPDLDFILGPELGVITAVVTLEKEEVIETLFGKIECYKLTMAPKGVIGLVYKKRFYFWYSTAPPHILILYEDSDGRVTKIEKPP